MCVFVFGTLDGYIYTHLFLFASKLSPFAPSLIQRQQQICDRKVLYVYAVDSMESHQDNSSGAIQLREIRHSSQYWVMGWQTVAVAQKIVYFIAFLIKISVSVRERDKKLLYTDEMSCWTTIAELGPFYGVYIHARLMVSEAHLSLTHSASLCARGYLKQWLLLCLPPPSLSRIRVHFFCAIHKFNLNAMNKV